MCSVRTDSDSMATPRRLDHHRINSDESSRRVLAQSPKSIWPLSRPRTPNLFWRAHVPHGNVEVDRLPLTKLTLIPALSPSVGRTSRDPQGTLPKHLDDVFAKLGVDTTAAAFVRGRQLRS